jgi:thymidine kinase
MTTKNESSQNTGYLELFIGPMFSGKTSKVLEIYKQCKFCNIPVIIINHSIDTRYHESMVSTHDKVMAPCIQTTLLRNIWDYNDIDSHFNDNSDRHIKLRTADVILINEGQFFEDLYEVVVDMLKSNKRVYICGLDSDFERKKFGQILDLIPLCDKVTKLTSLCSQCKDGTPGIFSMRLTSEKQQTLVGSDNYIPVCRKCYEIKNDNF